MAETGQFKEPLVNDLEESITVTEMIVNVIRLIEAGTAELKATTGEEMPVMTDVVLNATKDLKVAEVIEIKTGEMTVITPMIINVSDNLLWFRGYLYCKIEMTSFFGPIG
jgi:hypothetical protein